MLRQPIVATLGHVDSGKTSLLDAVRNTKVQSREAGAITQAIGASEVPVGVIKGICAGRLEKMHIALTIPGLLFIDTPGHEVFSNLRQRGGSIADIAIVVVDCARGVEAQTTEAITILKGFKTPFVVALNKVDALSGWRPVQGACFYESLAHQREDVAQELDAKVYSVVSQLYQQGFSAERFDRVNDFTKQIVIVPVSARTGEGLPDLLMLVAGLAQKFLEKRLSVDACEVSRASIMEVREEKGVGMTLDAILFDGTLQQGDFVAFPAVEGGVVSSRVKAILKPKPLDEMRDPSQKFSSINSVSAAAGVKIACEDAGRALAGGTLYASPREESLEVARAQIISEVREIVFSSEKDGVIIRADALGSLEAITKLFTAQGIHVRLAGIGSPSRKDVLEVSSVALREKFLGVVFAFNVPTPADVEQLAAASGVTLFKESIIYNLVAGYVRWKDELKAASRREAFATLPTPARIVLLKDHCFRQSKPCVVGVEVLEGTLKAGVELISASGGKVGVLKGIQHDKESVSEARKGQQVAVSIDGSTFGRGLEYGDELLVNVPKAAQELLETKYSSALSPGERDLLAELKRIRRA